MKPDSDERRDRVALLGLTNGILGTIARAGEAPGVPARHAVTRVAVCFDDGRPLRRRTIYPDYQMGRERDPKFIANEPTILRAIAAFSEAAAALPIEVLRGTNTEADDLIAGLVHAHPKVSKRIVSTDRDFLQLIDANLTVFAPVKKLVIDAAGFDDAVRPKGAGRMFPIARYVDYRALTGDASDTLPGVPGVGALSAVKLLADAPLDAYFGKPQAVRASLGRRVELVERGFADGSAQAIVERNRTLMDLRIPAPCWGELDALTAHGTWDRDAYQAWHAGQRLGAIPGLLDRFERLAAAA
jgi:DNA polymerase-1